MLKLGNRGSWTAYPLLKQKRIDYRLLKYPYSIVSDRISRSRIYSTFALERHNLEENIDGNAYLVISFRY